LPLRPRHGAVGARQRLGSGRGVLVYAPRGDTISPLRVYVHVVVPMGTKWSCRNHFSYPIGYDMTRNKTYSYSFSTHQRYPFSVCRKPLLLRAIHRKPTHILRQNTAFSDDLYGAFQKNCKNSLEYQRLPCISPRWPVPCSFSDRASNRVAASEAATERNRDAHASDSA
jgi:hypothetical protein